MAGNRSKFLVDGVPIDVAGVRWVNGPDQKLHGPQNISIPSVKLPGRDGELSLPSVRTVGPAGWDLSISVQGSDYSDFLANKAALEALLTPANRAVTLSEQVYDANGTLVRTLSASAMLTSASIDKPWNSPSDGMDATYSFHIPSGMWVEPEVAYSITGTGTFTVPALVGGSAPQYSARLVGIPSSARPYVTLAPSSGDAAVYVSAYQLTNGLPTSAQVDIDLANLVAVQSGTDYSGMVDSGTQQFHVNPDGIVKVTSFGNWSSLTLYSRKAWY